MSNRWIMVYDDGRTSAMHPTEVEAETMSFPEFFKMQKRMLVLAHREELLDQARKKFREPAPNFKVGIEQGDRQAADVTLSLRLCRRSAVPEARAFSALIRARST